MAERQKVLNLVNEIARGPRTTPSLITRFNAGERTVKRWIAEARTLGVQLSARQMEVNEEGRRSGPYYWEVENLDEIKPRLKQWLRLPEIWRAPKPRAKKPDKVY